MKWGKKWRLIWTTKFDGKCHDTQIFYFAVGLFGFEKSFGMPLESSTRQSRRSPNLSSPTGSHFRCMPISFNLMDSFSLKTFLTTPMRN